MASPSHAERPPLRNYDLDALSDDELEALLFDGEPPADEPEGKSFWRSGSAWKFVAFAAVMVVIASGGDLVGPMIFFLVLFYVAQRSCTPNGFSLPSFCGSGTGGKNGTHRDSNASLARSTTDKKLMGVCGGIADYFDIDAAPVRLGFILGLVATGGPPVALAYLGMAYVLPAAPRVASKADEERRMRIIRES